MPPDRAVLEIGGRYRRNRRNDHVPMSEKICQLLTVPSAKLLRLAMMSKLSTPELWCLRRSGIEKLDCARSDW